MNCLKFNVEGAYARFRRPYTTTSALTYSVMPPPQIKAMLAAYIGIDRSELYQTTQQWKIALEIRAPIRKDTQSTNLTSNKRSLPQLRFPSNIEFLRDIRYTLYLWCDDDVMPDFTAPPIFTPYLGCSEYLCSVSLQETISLHDCAPGTVDLNCVVPVDRFEPVFEGSGAMRTDTIPVHINRNREYVQYCKVFYPAQAQKLQGYIHEGFKKADNRILYFF